MARSPRFTMAMNGWVSWCSVRSASTAASQLALAATTRSLESIRDCNVATISLLDRDAPEMNMPEISVACSLNPSINVWSAVVWSERFFFGVLFPMMATFFFECDKQDGFGRQGRAPCPRAGVGSNVVDGPP